MILTYANMVGRLKSNCYQLQIPFMLLCTYYVILLSKTAPCSNLYFALKTFAILGWTYVISFAFSDYRRKTDTIDFKCFLEKSAPTF